MRWLIVVSLDVVTFFCDGKGHLCGRIFDVQRNFLEQLLWTTSPALNP